jgi:hypothetical protein
MLAMAMAKNNMKLLHSLSETLAGTNVVLFLHISPSVSTCHPHACKLSHASYRMYRTEAVSTPLQSSTSDVAELALGSHFATGRMSRK